MEDSVVRENKFFMRFESFNPNLIDPKKRLPPQEKFDPNKTIYRTSDETNNEPYPQEVLEKLRRRIATMDSPVPSKPPAIDQRPELTPTEAEKLEAIRDKVLADLRRKNASK